MKKIYVFLVVCLFIGGSVFNSSYAQQSSMGTDFWMGFNDFFDNSVTLRLWISSDVGATGTVAVPGQAYSVPFTVAANATTILNIPTATVYAGNSEVVTARAVHITSNNSIGVLASTYTAVRTETSIILPTPLLGTQYYVASYAPGGFNFFSEFMVVATANNTSIDITPSAITNGGKPANTTFTITLNAGEEYQVKASAFNGTKDLTGTKVAVSANNPCSKIAVFGGMNDGYVPINQGTADPLYEEMYPVNMWGTEYVVPPFYSSTTSTSQARIIASQNNTSVSVDGGAPFNLNAGQFNEQTFNYSAHCITADKPVSVAQYMRGNAASGATPNKGDPSMIMINPNDRKINKYVFTPYSNQMASRFVNVVMNTAYTGQFKLDGVVTGNFSPSSCTGYSYAIIPITNAFHTLFADSGFIGYVYGYGTGDESFANSLGWSTLTTAPTLSVKADTTNLCSAQCTNVTAVTSAGFIFNYNWTPNIGSGAGPFNVCPTTTTTYSVTAISACDTLRQSVTVNVSPCGTKPTTQFSSSDSAFCAEAGTCIDFTDLSTGNPTSWKWYFPGAVPDTSTMQNPTNICYYTPGTYSVKLVTANSIGSDSLTISPLITFGSGASLPVITISNDTIFCSHASAYQWYFNGSPIPGATDSFYVASQNGIYNVQITDSIGCIRLGNGVTFTLVDDLNGLDGMLIYPNPATTELWIESYGLWVGETKIEIYNVLGETISYVQLIPHNLSAGQAGQKRATIIDVSGFSKGIYILKAAGQNQIVLKKIIIQ